MSRCTLSTLHRCLPWLRLITSAALLSALAACGGGGPAQHAGVRYNPSRYYPPPGPPSDPWGPYIREAASRFDVPEQWIRGVMHQESGGQEDVISWAGAMGLMQVMPETYAELRSRYNLGGDPFDPHNNILAGTAYLREMYDRFGSPGFLAAYNAGPNRVDQYLNNGTPLPAETVNYVASISPRLGSGRPMSGPLAVYATRFAPRSTPNGCDPDAAYNPNGPCTALRPVVVAAAAPVFANAGSCDPDAAYNPDGPCTPARPVVVAAATPVYANSGDCDPDAAFDPNRPCQPRPVSAVVQPVIAEPLRRPMLARRPQYAVARRPEYVVAHRPMQESMALPVAFTAGPPAGRWAIQVGAFATLSTAQYAAERARSALPELLRTAKVELPATSPLGTQVAFRARLSGLSPAAAADACSRLTGRGTACITVSPSGEF
jgi:hypothetical protein